MLPQCNAIEPSAENRPFGRKVRPLKDLTACRARPPPLEMAHAEHFRVGEQASDKLFWHQNWLKLRRWEEPRRGSFLCSK
jgi:hypothetical protein